MDSGEFRTLTETESLRRTVRFAVVGLAVALVLAVSVMAGTVCYVVSNQTQQMRMLLDAGISHEDSSAQTVNQAARDGTINQTGTIGDKK